MKNTLNISIVIPTNGRVNLVERLLKSLVDERTDYPYGDVEVIIVNSGNADDSARIEALCKTYDAVFYAGENSVRKKRNLGITKANNEVILFLDSDVAAEPGLLQHHAETFLSSDDPQLGGSFGLTRFVGKKTWWWKIVEQTTYLDSFSFAERFPYNSWTIGNNVSFYRRILVEIGMFEENFPYPLGGDDLDMTYRVTKAGYRIKSTPSAVTLHSTETWNHPKAIYDRTHRWGSMEYYISQRHPEIFVNCIPKAGTLFSLALLLTAVCSLILKSTLPLLFWCAWFLINTIMTYTYDCIHKEGGNFFYYSCGKLIRTWYRFYYILEGVKHGYFHGFHREMSFSFEQTKYMQRRECAMFTCFMLSFAAALVIFTLRAVL